MTFTDILHKISARNDLSRDEAGLALQYILSGETADVQIAAFLFGMRTKGETVEELTGFVQTMREAAVRLDVNAEGAVDLCGTGGDHSGTFNISTGAMFVTAGAGVPVLKHGNRSISSASGSYDVLLELGAAPSLSAEQAKVCFEQTGVVFMYAPLFHPAMRHVMPARKGLGMRTFFNILGPLLNPAGVRRQVIGAYNRDTAQMMSRILANLDTEYAITLHAHDGLDEVSTTGLTDTFELKHAVSSDVIRFDPADLGYQRVTEESLKGGDSTVNAEIIRNIVTGKSTQAQRDIVELNAAFAIYCSGIVSNLSDAKMLAANSIDSGSAARSLEQFSTCSRDLAASGSSQV